MCVYFSLWLYSNVCRKDRWCEKDKSRSRILHESTNSQGRGKNPVVQEEHRRWGNTWHQTPDVYSGCPEVN